VWFTILGTHSKVMLGSGAHTGGRGRGRADGAGRGRRTGRRPCAGRRDRGGSCQLDRAWQPAAAPADLWLPLSVCGCGVHAAETCVHARERGNLPRERLHSSGNEYRPPHASLAAARKAVEVSIGCVFCLSALQRAFLRALLGEVLWRLASRLSLVLL